MTDAYKLPMYYLGVVVEDRPHIPMTSRETWMEQAKERAYAHLNLRNMGDRILSTVPKYERAMAGLYEDAMDYTRYLKEVARNHNPVAAVFLFDEWLDNATGADIAMHQGCVRRYGGVL